MNTKPTFESFGKIPRLSREVIITEKLDGTNAQIFIADDGEIFAGSRNRWITPTDDNYGFAQWVEDNARDLIYLGPGRHFGEWWGKGIQRGYNQTCKRFSLFNTARFVREGEPRTDKQIVLPSCCSLVPVLYKGEFSTVAIEHVIEKLRLEGSAAAPGFMKPEGIIVYHTASQGYFKKILDKDELSKSEQQL